MSAPTCEPCADGDHVFHVRGACSLAQCECVETMADPRGSAEKDAPETYSVADIERAFEKWASPDDWGVPAFYLGGLLSALRGEYDADARVIPPEQGRT